ncbi:MAG TPA: acetyl-coenzyme A synthetase N-terminal domain-containing protein, partial [Bacteroidia bacterium]|nr:acetyl-coenzyme A synthetase N-terminal domain-containing protein [Bacteroidia bacterium]
MYPYQITSAEQYTSVYRNSIENPEKFWANIAQYFTWQKAWDKVLDADFEKAEVKWFAGAKLNITENCLDRHIEKLASQPAI